MVTNVNLRMTTGTRGGTSPLIDQLARKADGNHDGTVTSAEFTAFLSSLMQSLDAEARTAAGGESAGESLAAAPTPPPALDGVQPATTAAVVEAWRRAIAAARGE